MKRLLLKSMDALIPQIMVSSFRCARMALDYLLGFGVWVVNNGTSFCIASGEQKMSYASPYHAGSNKLRKKTKIQFNHLSGYL